MHGIRGPACLPRHASIWARRRLFDASVFQRTGPSAGVDGREIRLKRSLPTPAEMKSGLPRRAGEHPVSSLSLGLLLFVPPPPPFPPSPPFPELLPEFPEPAVPPLPPALPSPPLPW